ncbi:hypothetical protein SAMN05421831_102185 [Allopseudospirillum japonicum]|uniref:Uncharacterized protein n=1 Tax=Allopseudospirillum japonicum TaxID=64971 RepID=A0A1H6QT36_9GAMM|nr:hypothetical protein [Allopseudospirillum japonicum]SEI46861.1 hypothetical protein SAMN05421831_102185 [Allopseudospirillum japonicum]
MTQSKSSHWRLNLLMLLTLMTLVVAGWYLIEHTQEISIEPQVRWFPPETDCALETQGSCESQIHSAKVRLTVPPNSLKVLTPIPIEVHTELAKVQEVILDFQGRDMYMGINRYPLSRKSDHLYTGEGILSICTDEDMVWRARILFKTPQGWLGTWFDFQVPHP